MALSTEILSQFAKIVAPKESRPEFTVVTGRAKSYAGKMYVQIDGSDQLTPIASSTVGLKDNDWITVQIKNHSATVTGNATDPSAGKSYADDIKNQVDDAVDQISEFEIIIADKVDVGDLNAVNGRIDNLVSDNVTIKEKLTATEAEIDSLTADNVTINEKLTAAEADIENLTVTKLDVDIANAKYATIENLEATNADIHNLEADYGSFKQLTTDNFTAVNGSIANLEANKLDVTEAEIKYANIDFTNIGVTAVEELFAKSGIIEDLVVSGGHITGELVGVTIKGDLIEGNTIKADKLVVLGEDGLYYKLNVNAETVGAEQTQYNSLNGSIITANTITAEKINVDDLVAFNATIGGYHITDGSLYSGAKASATNTTRGVFMGDDGQFAVGDSNNYLRFINDDGTWKLEISAASIKMGGSNTTIEEEITNIKNDVTNAGKITEKSCGEIISIGKNGGKTPYSLMVHGSTRQNLWVNPSGTSNGVTVTANANGSITLSGTASAGATFSSEKLYVLRPGSTYTLSIDKLVTGFVDGCGIAIHYYDIDDTLLGSFAIGRTLTKATYETSSNAAYAICRINFSTDATVSGTYRVMLNEGSTAQPWCPPGLNGVDELSVVTAGKNLIGPAGYHGRPVAGVTATSGDDGSVTVSGTLSGNQPVSLGNLPIGNLLPPGTYTVSDGCEDGLVYVQVNNGVGGSICNSRNNNTGELGFAADKPYWFIGVMPGFSGTVTIYPQLELGSTATDYEPPQVTATPIDLDGHALNSLPDGTRDELSVDATGAVTLTQRVGVATAPMEASGWAWATDVIGGRAYFSVDRTPMAIPNSQADHILCDRLPPRMESLDETSYVIVVKNSKCYVRNPAITDTTTAASIAGGMTVIYPLVTPQTIELPSVELPELPAPSANVWMATPVPTTACMEYWTVEGAKVAEAQSAADSAQSAADSAQSAADSAQSAADESLKRVNSAEIEIDSLNATISSLVVGEDGRSLMTQTDEGFRFDFSSFQEQIQHALDTATSAESDLSQVSSDIDSLKESTSYITELNSYITMGDSEGTPYIELGQKDGEFKVRITNTEMSFMQGTDRIAYITNNQLYIQSSVVTDEMKIGATDGFIWKRRGNGNMGLRWVNGDYES